MPEQPLAPQSLLDAATEQAQEEKKLEEASLISKSRFTLPRFSIDSLFDKRRRLKSRVKMLLIVYGVVVFGALILECYSLWKEEQSLQDRYDVREAQYIDILSTIDLAELSEGQRSLYSAFQEKNDPIYALYAFETLAIESGVSISNPSYSFSSASESGQGVKITTSVNGSQSDIINFFQIMFDFKPLISIESFSASPTQGGDNPSYTVQTVVVFAAVPTLEENIYKLEYKLDEKYELPFPIRGLSDAISQVENLRTLPFQGLQQSTYGKQNLFTGS